MDGRRSSDLDVGRSQANRLLTTHTDRVCERYNPTNKPGDVRRHPQRGLAESKRYIIGFGGQAIISNQKRFVFISPSGWRQRANLIVRISLLERPEMLEDVKRDLESRPCDLYMGSPAAQLLIA
jgi:hypothetical protein